MTGPSSAAARRVPEGCTKSRPKARARASSGTTLLIASPAPRPVQWDTAKATPAPWQRERQRPGKVPGFHIPAEFLQNQTLNLTHFVAPQIRNRPAINYNPNKMKYAHGNRPVASYPLNTFIYSIAKHRANHYNFIYYANPARSGKRAIITGSWLPQKHYFRTRARTGKPPWSKPYVRLS
jgi:hypothetical protein